MWCDNRILLDVKREQSRPTTRHKYRTDKCWSRLDKRNNTLEYESPSAGSVGRALAHFRERLIFEEPEDVTQPARDERVSLPAFLTDD